MAGVTGTTAGNTGGPGGRRRPFTRRLAVIVSVALAGAVIVSLLIVAVFYGAGFAGFGYLGYTTTRNSDAYQVSSGYSVAFAGGSINLNVRSSNNGTVYLTVSATSYLLGIRPSINITSAFAQNGVNFTVTTPRTGISHSTANLYLPYGMVAGNVSLTASNGNIVMSEPAASGTLYAVTSNGNIEASVSTSDEIHLQADNGNIQFMSQSFQNLTAVTQNGNINLQIIGSILTTGSTSLSTQNGNIAIDINPQQSVRVDASTSLGGVSTWGLQFTLITTTSRTFSGVLGTGSAKLDAVTTNGSIYISS